jgi:hypothetical protein
VRLPNLARLIGIVGIVGVAVMGAAADLLVLAGGVSLLGAHYPANDLVGSGLTPSAVAMRGRLFVALGLWPLVGALVVAVLRFRVRRRRPLHVAVVAALVGQAVALAAALASTL